MGARHQKSATMQVAGVPVAAEEAEAPGAPLNLVLVRKVALAANVGGPGTPGKLERPDG